MQEKIREIIQQSILVKQDVLEYDDLLKRIEKIVDEIVAIAKKNSEEFELLKNLSRYGRTNDAEFFAEVFATMDERSGSQ